MFNFDKIKEQMTPESKQGVIFTDTKVEDNVLEMAYSDATTRCFKYFGISKDTLDIIFENRFKDKFVNDYTIRIQFHGQDNQNSRYTLASLILEQIIRSKVNPTILNLGSLFNYRPLFTSDSLLEMISRLDKLNEINPNVELDCDALGDLFREIDDFLLENDNDILFYERFGKSESDFQNLNNLMSYLYEENIIDHVTLDFLDTYSEITNSD